MPRSRKPAGVPEGTAWFGGDIERVRVTLRVLGDEVRPEEISQMLGVAATRGGRKGEPVLRADGTTARLRRTGVWLLDHVPAADATVDEALAELLDKLPTDAAVWKGLVERFQVDLLCDVTVRGVNQGFVLSPAALQAVVALGIPLGVDVFTEADDEQAARLAERFKRLE